MALGTRVVATVAIVTITMAALAGCGGPSGVNAQDGPTAPDSASTSTKGPPTIPSPSSTPPTSWTPPPYGNAAPAVATYMKLNNASIAAFKNPAHVSAATLDRYLGGQAKLSFDQSLASARKQGIAYRGTAATPRVTVVSAKLDSVLPEVVLRDCGLAASSDSYVAYYTATGKPVPTSKPKVPPPYANTIKVFQPNHKSWVITSFVTDASKTCAP